MVKIVEFEKSSRPGYKYMVVLQDSDSQRTIHFGATGYNDYTTHPAKVREARKQAYLLRHKVTEDWKDPLTAGFWSRWILWNKPSVTASLKDVKSRFNL